MRTLVWVSVVHAEADLGSLTDAVRREYSAGGLGWAEHQQAIASFWEAIRTATNGLGLDPHAVRLYQDGLPICEREDEIVRAMARAGSPNHAILLDWMDRGATLMGTESPELLREEYRIFRQLFGANETRPIDRPALQARSRDILARRDAFIACRITDTLRPGETGLLFLGLLHSLEGLLPGDIRIVRIGGVAPRS